MRTDQMLFCHRWGTDFHRDEEEQRTDLRIVVADQKSVFICVICGEILFPIGVHRCSSVFIGGKIFLFHLTSQHGQPAVEQAAERAVAQRQLPGDRFVIGPGEVAEHEDLAVFLGQRAQDG